MAKNMIPKAKAKGIYDQLERITTTIERLEVLHGDECKMDRYLAQCIQEKLDEIGAFVINSLE